MGDKKLLVIAVMAIVGSATFTAFMMWEYQEHLERLYEGIAPHLREFYTPLGFLNTPYGFASIASWLLAGISVLGLLLKSQRDRLMLAAAVSLVLLSTSACLPVVRAEDTIYVDVMMVMDEEAQSSHLDAFFYMDGVWNRDFANYDPTPPRTVFRFHHTEQWIIWDSDDSEHSISDALERAVTQLGWSWNGCHCPVCGEQLELLFILSGQGYDDFIGYSAPWDRAMIVSALNHKTLMHELGHQYDLHHCPHGGIIPFGEGCPMSDTPETYWSRYCGDCWAIVDINQYCWFSPPPDNNPVDSFEGRGGGKDGSVVALCFALHT